MNRQGSRSTRVLVAAATCAALALALAGCSGSSSGSGTSATTGLNLTIEDYYSQPAALFRLFDAAQRERFFGNIARHINGVPQDILTRQLEHFRRIDPAYAEGVIAALATLNEKAM